MGHEIGHSFDELGNIYDAEGRLVHWWTAEDLARYHAETAKLAAQFNGYCPLANLCVNGGQGLGENAADPAGLLGGHDGYLLSLESRPRNRVDGGAGEK